MSIHRGPENLSNTFLQSEAQRFIGTRLLATEALAHSWPLLAGLAHLGRTWWVKFAMQRVAHVARCFGLQCIIMHRNI